MQSTSVLSSLGQRGKPESSQRLENLGYPSWDDDWGDYSEEKRRNPWSGIGNDCWTANAKRRIWSKLEIVS